MREIKFRGISTDEKVWIYGNLLISQNPRHNFETLIIPQEKCNSYMAIIPSTVGQYTGARDINGNEIYEGDIVKRTSVTLGGTDFIGVVKYEEDAFWIEKDEKAFRLFQEVDPTKILGNIYENPKLLEGEENASK